MRLDSKNPSHAVSRLLIAHFKQMEPKRCGSPHTIGLPTSDALSEVGSGSNGLRCASTSSNRRNLPLSVPSIYLVLLDQWDVQGLYRDFGNAHEGFFGIVLGTPVVKLFCWEKGLLNNCAKGIATLPLLRASENTNPY